MHLNLCLNSSQVNFKDEVSQRFYILEAVEAAKKDYYRSTWEVVGAGFLYQGGTTHTGKSC